MAQNNLARLCAKNRWPSQPHSPATDSPPQIDPNRSRIAAVFVVASFVRASVAGWLAPKRNDNDGRISSQSAAATVSMTFCAASYDPNHPPTGEVSLSYVTVARAEGLPNSRCFAILDPRSLDRTSDRITALLCEKITQRRSYEETQTREPPQYWNLIELNCVYVSTLRRGTPRPRGLMN